MIFKKTIQITIFTVFAALFSGPSGVSAQKAISGSVAECASVTIGTSQFECECPANGARRSVWGSGPYTSDSDLCTAALHAGAIGLEGGLITVRPEPGQSSYQSTTAFGVTTSNWASYGSSFMVLVSAVECGVMPGDQTLHTCSCPQTAAVRSVWGSGPYTSDSDICTAARHDGAIDLNGGIVHVMKIEGLQSYSASTENGVTTSGWANYGSSIIFNQN
ncbi:LCCL domain-containing protein [Cochlodiniinecator piscidefendens]|uniref:LCCL domain-containing protein n=1 Tax=Cochlodiniinecator piscidefendens TaxID=2715756 RepID=UPI00140DFAB4|nr:LCCL domain-containing protein [Cochlodiniinecator piscidefendens]